MIAASGIIAFAAALAMAAPGHAVPDSGNGTGSILKADSPYAVADRYLVVFKDQPGVTAQRMVDRFGGTIRHRFDAGSTGFSATMTRQQALAMSTHPHVAYVEQVQRMGVLDTQNNPPNWGDDRIDQRDLPLDQAYTYPSNGGEGATVYVMDTGARFTHQDFTGRITSGPDYIDNDQNSTDCHGHGTHVAGTAAGTTYGVAKKADIVAIRVLDCQGYGGDDDFIAAINWIKDNRQGPSVVNYSIGCGSPCSSPTLDSAVNSLIQSGVQFVMAAGNSNQDACGFSPQKVAAGITVGNTTNQDAKNSGSSWGSCLDIFAPGTSIVSASYSSDTGSATMTGTSMASPHVAGAVALYLGQNPSATPQQARDALVNNGTTGKVSNPGSGSPNVLLYTGFLNSSPGNDFAMSVSPSSGSADPGKSVTATVQTTVTEGSAQQVSLSASGLPSGASASFSPSTVTAGNNSSMQISTSAGTPPGTYTVTVTGDGADVDRTASFSLTVNGDPGSELTVTNPGSQSDEIGESVSLQLEATGGTTPYSWDATGLPPGLSVSTAGLISGSPTTAGTYPVTATVTDPDGLSDSAEFSWTITAPPTGACDGYQNTYTGSLSSGGTAVQPNGTYYYSFYSGYHRGCLVSAAGTDFDLYLQKWTGWGWTTVAQSTSPSNSETINYYGTSGYYRYLVHAYSGSGSYTVGITRP